jgi:hypothetical protein
VRRWRFLEDNPATTNPGWFPSAVDCPELAELRAKHERLLLGFHEALKALGDLKSRAESEKERQGKSLLDAILAGGSPTTTPLPEPSVTEEELAEAGQRAEVARDALQTFAEDAVQSVRAQAGAIRAGLAGRFGEADAKRDEARRLLAEAERLSAEPMRLQHWLDRATGASVLGLYPFEQMEVPVPVPVPGLFQEIAGLAPGEVIEVGGDEPTGYEVEVMTHA